MVAPHPNDEVLVAGGLLKHSYENYLAERPAS